MILIKYASYGRPKLFKDTINNIVNTIGRCNYKICVSVNEDDVTMNNEDIRFFCKDNDVDLFVGSYTDKINAINSSMDIICRKYDWRYLVNMSDDMKFVISDWGVVLEEDFKNIGCDSFLHYNDGFIGEKLPTMSIMDREYFERFHYIYHPIYKSYSCDAEAMFVAQMLGKWHYIDKVIFKHLHPANDISVKSDNTYKRADMFIQYDTDVYFKRLKKLFYVNNPSFVPELMKPYL